jgi:hypothetical protein
MVRQYAGNRVPTDDQMHQLWGIAGKKFAQAPSASTQSPPAKATAPAAAAPQKLPTVQQLIKENINKPEFAQYSAYAGMIPDQNLPVDQWKQKHGDLYNNPMAAPFRSIFDKSMQAQATPAPTPAAAQPQQRPAMPPPFPPMPPPRPQQQIAGQVVPPQQQQGPLSTAGNPLNIPTNLTQSEQRGISQFASGLPRQPQQQQSSFPPLPTPRPMQAPQSMQQQAVNNIKPPSAQAPQQPSPQPQSGSTQQMPDFAPGTGGYNDEYGIHPPYPMPQQAGPQMNMPAPPAPPPMPQPSMQAGLNAGTPPIGGTDWALPSNRGMNPGNIQPGLSGGTPFPFSVGGGGDMGGGSFGGMGGAGMGMGGGDTGGGMGGGGKGGGSKVNMQAAIAMLPKPIQITQQQLPQIQPIRPGAPMPPGQQGDMSLAQTIMSLLQGGQQQAG